MSHVRIGPEFFAKAKNDYADWRRAWVREILQNSIDATNCNNITLTIEPSKENQTKVTAHNDGDSMDEHTLTTKLLSLGSSGKNFNGTTGGFGKAKELLYLTHPSYQIRTGTHQVDGSGGEYELTKTPHDEYTPGTTSTVTMEGNQTELLLEATQELAAQTQWHGTLTVNGHITPTNLRKGTPRKELTWAKIYTNRSQQNIAIIRINGLPMFTRYVSYNGCVLIELTGNSNEILTSNRDGLTHPHREQLNEFITSLTVDKKSALRTQAPTYEIYRGTNQRVKLAIDQPGNTPNDLTNTITSIRTRIAATTPTDEREPSTAEPSTNIGHTLIIKNTTGLETPAHYRPGPNQSNYAKKLITTWAAILLKLHEILNRHDQFNIGLLIDEENIAEHEQGPHGTTYYINPTTIVSQKNNPNCKSLKNRYPGAWQARHTLIALALHEITHATHRHHDDSYASQLTEYTDKALQHINEITPLCRG